MKNKKPKGEPWFIVILDSRVDDYEYKVSFETVKKIEKILLKEAIDKRIHKKGDVMNDE